MGIPTNGQENNIIDLTNDTSDEDTEDEDVGQDASHLIDLTNEAGQDATSYFIDLTNEN